MPKLKLSNEQQIGAAILLTKEDKVLLGKRKGGYMPGAFGLPGGRVKLGETLIKTSKRELTEETGLKSKILKYLGVIREDQKEYIFVHFIFVCEEFSGEVKNMEPEKCEGWEWFDLGKLPKNMLKGHAAALELFLQNKNLIDLSS